MEDGMQWLVETLNQHRQSVAPNSAIVDSNKSEHRERYIVLVATEL